MKKLFIICFVCLIIASAVTYLTIPAIRSDIPILYWVTKPNPVRQKQVEAFHRWLKKNNYPEFELRLDIANDDYTKLIIQGVSGIAADIIDVPSNIFGGGLHYFQQIGLLEDITDSAIEMEFDLSHTFENMRTELMVDDRQYAFGGNVWLNMCWVNVDTLKKYDIEIPPERWDFDTFERIGKEFVAKANKGLDEQEYFFTYWIDRRAMYRSLGLSIFNETLTACTMDDPRYAEVLKRFYKWTFVDHLRPTKGQAESFVTASGFGGFEVASANYLFYKGNYATITGGRYMIIRFREFEKPMNLRVVEQPNGGFPNVYGRPRAIAIYAGSKNKELAKYFMAFLASEDYADTVVENGDSLPPNPKYTDSEKFNKPAEYPNEWFCHKPFAEAGKNIAMPPVHSPFVLYTTVHRIENEMWEGFTVARIYSAEEAGKLTTDKINAEIQRTLDERADLKIIYDEKIKLQQKIDLYKREGKKIPGEWIDNHFLKKYYKFKGWLE